MERITGVMYHLSSSSRIRYLKPRIPLALLKHEYPLENRIIARVSFSSTIGGLFTWLIWAV